MPSLITKRGRKRWRACVRLIGPDNERIEQQKLFADDSRQAERAALRWEETTTARLQKAFKQKTPTAFLTLVQWATAYLDHVRLTQSKDTYTEKRFAFYQLAGSKGMRPDLPVAEITAPVAYRHLSGQAKARAGNAANKDRKNLSTAWS